ncbi:MAG: putative lipid II flippase FtsW [Candidatus Omnitrophica bacterium]|nr:putative lipid II flippase FtsW [Candidatus Omnitrophota bacterium]
MKPLFDLKGVDRTLLITPLLIFAIGIANVYSASFRTGMTFDQTLATKQVIWMGVALLAMLMVSRFNYLRLSDIAWPLYALTLVLLVAVLFTPPRLGARRWLHLGLFSFQPSELAKLAVILVLARFFAENRREYQSRARALLPFIIVGVPFLLILKEPDLGTGLLLMPAFFAMLYLWGFRGRVILGLLGLGLALSPVFFHFLREYQRNRILVFLNPDLDPLGAGYTIIQSKIAIGSGGLLGKGFMGGTQNQLHFLPERHTDFIFGVVGEEGGFLLCSALFALFWVLVRRGFIIAAQTPERFGSQLACGISALLGMQAFINLGMTMGLLPVVGVPLPLVSYGGTSLVTTLSMIGLLISIRRHRPLF